MSENVHLNESNAYPYSPNCSDVLNDDGAEGAEASIDIDLFLSLFLGQIQDSNAAVESLFQTARVGH